MTLYNFYRALTGLQFSVYFLVKICWMFFLTKGFVSFFIYETIQIKRTLLISWFLSIIYYVWGSYEYIIIIYYHKHTTKRCRSATFNSQKTYPNEKGISLVLISRNYLFLIINSRQSSKFVPMRRCRFDRLVSVYVNLNKCCFIVQL